MRLRELFEAPRAAVMAFGRMNPPTIGHAKLVDKIKSLPGDPYIFLSQSQKPKTDPLAFADKLRYAKFFFPEVTIGNPEVKTIIQALQKINELGYKNLIYVAGSDRVQAFEEMINKYNGQPDKEGNVAYNFDTIQVVSAGERDPDADGAEGMSASKMRAAAAAGDLESFKQGVPNQEVADEMYAAVRAGMGIKDKEAVPAESIEEANYGRYYCSTDKKWKTRKSPKKSRVSETTTRWPIDPHTLRWRNGKEASNKEIKAWWNSLSQVEYDKWWDERENASNNKQPWSYSSGNNKFNYNDEKVKNLLKSLDHERKVDVDGGRSYQHQVHQSLVDPDWKNPTGGLDMRDPEAIRRSHAARIKTQDFQNKSAEEKAAWDAIVAQQIADAEKYQKRQSARDKETVPAESIEEQTYDRNKLIAVVNLNGEVKEFDLTGRFQGDTRTQIKQAETFLNDFLKKKSIPSWNMEIHYQGAVSRTNAIGQDAPDAPELDDFANRARQRLQQQPRGQ